MAILVVQIEDVASLLLNEFFDYNGYCYAVTHHRRESETFNMPLEDFYEATIEEDEITDVPVVFIRQDSLDSYIVGWYNSATIWRNPKHLTLFLEGNIRAMSGDVVLLPEPLSLEDFYWHSTTQLYEVIENEDQRYHYLKDYIDGYSGANSFKRYPYIHVNVDNRVARDYDMCIGMCMELAGAIMNNTCQGIEEIKALEQYAQIAERLMKNNADGYYYHAMACHQLGFLKEGMKAIEKALQLEPEAADIVAQKAYLLFGMGYYEEGARLFHSAYDLSKEDEYLLLEGRLWLITGQLNRAAEIFCQIENEEILSESDISMDEMRKMKELFSFVGK